MVQISTILMKILLKDGWLLVGKRGNMDNKVILQNLIEFYQNDLMHGYHGDDKEELRIILLELIVAVTRYVNNFRYCSNQKCSCSPESHIRRIVQSNQDKIFDLLKHESIGLKKLSQEIEEVFGGTN